MTMSRRLVLVALVTVATLLLAQHPAHPAEWPFADKGKAVTKTKDAAQKDQTSPDNTPLIKAQQESGTDRALRQNAEENVKINRELAKYTGWLIVATLFGPAVLLIAVLYQAWIARDAEKRQLRAYVVVKEVIIEPRFRQPDARLIGVTGRVVFLNSGQTPAYDLEHSRSLTMDSFTLRRDFQPPTRFLSNMVILGPHVEHPDDLGVSTDCDSDSERLCGGMLAVYFWGEVRYRDIFNRKQRTRFGVRWPRIPSKVGDRGTVPCSPDWNDAT